VTTFSFLTRTRFFHVSLAFEIPLRRVLTWTSVKPELELMLHHFLALRLIHWYSSVELWIVSE
jgi:hypothetical protein